VRFIDNFSGGTRGALSAEQFLAAGYGVIFLSRRHSIQPFTKGLPPGLIVDRLTQILRTDGGGPAGLDVVADAASGGPAALVAAALTSARAAAEAGTLLRISFETLFEYLVYLKAIATTLAPCGPRAAFYLAAAVSDFYIPLSSMAEHKIQSSAVGDAGLTLTLTKTPKLLGALRREWAPRAFVAGFKLETDETVLVAKAAKSIQAYGLHCVVANILETRKDRVLLVTPKKNGGEGAATSDPASFVDVAPIDRDPTESFIERQLVEAVVRLHARYMKEEGGGV
jgi:phosphopantothenate---cysteine ligase (ATP)